MKKRIDLHEKEYKGITYKSYIEIELKKENKESLDTHLNKVNSYYAFSASGGIYEKGNDQWHECSFGQNIDIIKEIYNNKTVNDIFSLWEKYHLNDMNGGTELQTAVIRRYEINNPSWRYDYKEACEILKTIDKKYGRPVAYQDRGYKYGHAWLVKIIPDDVLLKMQELFE